MIEIIIWLLGSFVASIIIYPIFHDDDSEAHEGSDVAIVALSLCWPGWLPMVIVYYVLRLLVYCPAIINKYINKYRKRKL